MAIVRIAVSAVLPIRARQGAATFLPPPKTGREHSEPDLCAARWNARSERVFENHTRASASLVSMMRTGLQDFQDYRISVSRPRRRSVAAPQSERRSPVHLVNPVIQSSPLQLGVALRRGCHKNALIRAERDCRRQVEAETWRQSLPQAARRATPEGVGKDRVPPCSAQIGGLRPFVFTPDRQP